MKALITGGARRPNGQFAKVRTIPWVPENWDDGWVDRKGRFHVYRPDYLRSSSTGWAFRSHIVWWLETGQAICHPLAVHHSNHDRLDDRFENLQLMLAGEHTRYHSQKLLIGCRCETCGEIFFLPQWRINGGRGRWCSVLCARRSQENRSRVSMLAKRTFTGRPGFWKGKQLSQQHRERISLASRSHP